MEKDKDRDERTHDLYGEDDIAKSSLFYLSDLISSNYLTGSRSNLGGMIDIKKSSRVVASKQTTLEDF
jgi:hypothetical protein